jgi:hypothetical protein
LHTPLGIAQLLVGYLFQNSFIDAMRSLVIMQLLLIQLAAAAVTPLAANITMDGCERKCGEVDVPYPFGTSYGCHRRGFKVICDRAYSPPKLFLGGDEAGLEVLGISVRNKTVRVRAMICSFGQHERRGGQDHPCKPPAVCALH